jgi:ABC-type polysaccharide/polyol phosphate export permease
MNDSMGAVRNLLYNLVRRDLTVRYKSTVLGFFWSFIKPLAMTGIFYVVFQRILGLRLRPGDESIPLALHMLAGMLVWNLFAGASADAMNVILANANLIKKVRLPLAVFPIATVVSHLVHFILALLVLVALLILAGLPPTLAYLWLVPLMALHFLLTLAVSLILSALNVFYRDVASIWEVLTTAWFYATPIIYPAYMVTQELPRHGLPAWLKYLYLCNPLTPLALGYRHVLIYASAEGARPEMEGLWGALVLCLGMTLLLLAVALRIFRHFARSFADEL